ncbi:MAG: DUF123 domain-containing protein [Candidatus Nanohaloarchaea archaeon]
MKGVYILLLRLEKERKIEVGALGTIKFDSGIYVYTGSARNSLESRLERHFNTAENKFWHIDYLSEEAEVFDCFILPEKSDFECVMAGILSGFCGSVDGFGCSDCDCSSHLFIQNL